MSLTRVPRNIEVLVKAKNVCKLHIFKKHDVQGQCISLQTILYQKNKRPATFVADSGNKEIWCSQLGAPVRISTVYIL